MADEETNLGGVTGGLPTGRATRARRNFLLGLGIGAAALALIGGAAAFMTMQGSVGRDLAKKVRLAMSGPAAKVNGVVITMADFEGDLDSAKRFFEQSSEAGEVPTEAELRQGVMDRLVEQVILRQEAERLGVVVTDEQVNEEFTQLVEAEGGDPEAQIAELYGWTVDQFKEKVLRSFLLEQGLSAKLQADEAQLKEIEAEAQEALARLEAGEEFAVVASEMSDDQGSALQGGELGSFARGVTVPEFEAAAFALPVGETSGLVLTQFGYHIINVTGETLDDNGDRAEVEASHILIGLPTPRDYLAAKTAEASIEKFVE